MLGSITLDLGEGEHHTRDHLVKLSHSPCSGQEGKRELVGKVERGRDRGREQGMERVRDKKRESRDKIRTSRACSL